MRRTLLVAAAGVLAVLGLLEAGVQPATAATFTVTNTNDSGAGSLREAIALANQTAGADTINFSLPAGPQVISLLTLPPVITSPVTIDGAGVDLTIDGAAVAPGAIFQLSADSSAFRALKLKNVGTGIVHACSSGAISSLTVEDVEIDSDATAIFLCSPSISNLTISNTKIEAGSPSISGSALSACPSATCSGTFSLNDVSITDVEFSARSSTVSFHASGNPGGMIQAQNVAITGSSLEAQTGPAIFISSSVIQAEGVNIRENTITGPVVLSGAGGGSWIDGVAIQENISITAGASSAVIIQSLSNSNIDISENGPISGGNGVSIGFAGGSNSGVTIRHNESVTGSPGLGLSVIGAVQSDIEISGNGPISGNTGINVGTPGASNTSVSIRENQAIAGASQVGVRVSGANNSDIAVEDNGAVSGGSLQGVIVGTTGSSNTSIDIRGNASVGSNGSSAIQVLGLTNSGVTVANNVNIISGGSNGILVGNAGPVLASNSSIAVTGNASITSNGASGAHGVLISGVANNAIDISNNGVITGGGPADSGVTIAATSGTNTDLTVRANGAIHGNLRGVAVGSTSNTNVDVSLNGLIEGGSGGIAIGALTGSVTNTNVIIASNSSVIGQGTAIGVGGTAAPSITNTKITITNNRATGGEVGVGIAAAALDPSAVTISQIVIAGNEVSGGDEGLHIVGANPDAAPNSVTGNTVTDSGIGIRLSAVTNLVVAANAMQDVDGGVVLELGTTDVLLEHNVVHYGDSAGIDADATSGANVAHLNDIVGAGLGVHNGDAAREFDATCNFWGDSSGPIPLGQPVKVLGNVAFAPWLLASSNISPILPAACQQ